MQAAYHVKFSGAFANTLFGTLVDLFERERVGAGSAWVAAESAELAVRNADIRRINVTVDVEIGDVAVALFAHMIGKPAYGEKIGRAIESDAIAGREALARKDFRGDGLQTLVCDRQVSHRVVKLLKSQNSKFPSSIRCLGLEVIKCNVKLGSPAC